MKELKEYLGELEKKAFNKKKLLAFSLEFPRKTGDGFYILSERETSLAICGACKIFDIQILKEILEIIDGRVDYILIDVEVKNLMFFDVEKLVRGIVKNSKIIPIKVNDFTAMAADLFISQLVDIANKKIIIVGAGNIGSKLALRLSERCANVFVTGRDVNKLKVIVDGLNKVKTNKELKINVFDVNELSAFDGADMIIGFAPSGSQVISKEMVGRANKDVIILDGGIGNVQIDAFSLPAKFVRLDARNGFCGYVDAAIKTNLFINNDIGERVIDGKRFVAGGIIGKEGDVILDSIKMPNKIIGLADGKGSINRETLNNVQLTKEIEKKLFKKTFVFRVDGGSSDKNRPRNEQGMGHISRSLVLAEYLQERGFDIAFIMKHLPGINKIKEAGFKVYEIDEADSEEEQIVKILKELYNVYLIIDKLDVDGNYVKKIKPYCKKVVSVDNKGSGALYTDLNLYPLVKMPKEFSYNSVCSLNLVLLKKEFFEYFNKEKKINKEVKKILVTMGGTDPTRTTLKIVRALKEIKDVDVSVIVGYGFNFKKEIEKIVAKNDRFKILQDVRNMEKLLFDADIVITSGGVTVFEAAFVGTPQIVICHNQGELEHGFSEYGFALNLGLTDTLDNNNIYKAIISLMENHGERIKMSKTGKSLFKEDSRELILNLIENGKYS